MEGFENFDFERRSDEAMRSHVSYKRGYHHAFEEAVRLVRDGVDIDDLMRHADRVERWRETPLAPDDPPRYVPGRREPEPAVHPEFDEDYDP